MSKQSWKVYNLEKVDQPAKYQSYVYEFFFEICGYLFLPQYKSSSKSTSTCASIWETVATYFYHNVRSHVNSQVLALEKLTQTFSSQLPSGVECTEWSKCQVPVAVEKVLSIFLIIIKDPL